MRSTFNILFYINKQKIKKNGKCPIMGRITIDGKVVQYSAKEEVEPKFWDAKEGCCSGKSNDCKRINIRLDELKETIEQYYQKDIERSGYVTAEGIKNAIQGIGTNNNTLLKEFSLMREEIKNSIGITHTRGTYYRYGNAYYVIRDFVKYKYGADDVEFSRINKQFMEDYHFYLLTVRNFSTYTIQNYVRFMKHTIERAVNKENPVQVLLRCLVLPVPMQSAGVRDRVLLYGLNAKDSGIGGILNNTRQKLNLTCHCIIYHQSAGSGRGIRTIGFGIREIGYKYVAIARNNWFVRSLCTV